jgi:hypothetical protein
MMTMKKVYIFLLFSMYLWAGREVPNCDYFKEPEPKKNKYTAQEQKEREEIAEQKLLRFEIEILQIRTHLGFEICHGNIGDIPEGDYEQLSEQEFLALGQRFNAVHAEFKRIKKSLSEIYKLMPEKKKRLRMIETQINKDKYYYDNNLTFIE